MTRTTTTRLADGREILYFDDAGSAARSAESLVDHRELPARPEAGQLRFDALSREWVAVAAHRQSRTHLPPADQCPICPTTPANQTEIPAPDYDVAVFENRFPSLGPDTSEIPPAPVWGTTAPAVGRCEVVAFTPEHTGSFAELGWRRTRTVVDAWAHRTAALSARPGIRQVFPFENRGADIGVTLHHPHGQIYAYPYVTPRAAVLAAAAGEFFDNSDGTATLTSSLLRAERSDGSRMVLEGEHFSAYVPFAARWPLEVHLVPHRQVPDLAALSGAERDELAHLYPELLRRFDALYPTPTPYIAAWHQAPLEPAKRQAGQLHLQLTSPRRAADKLKYLAGSEAAMGAFINDTTPESVAARLREVAGEPDPATLAPEGAPDPGRRPRMNTTTRTGARTGALADRFEATFGAAPHGVWAAPGRVNLIGEHTDYNEGFVLPFAIDKRARTAVRLRNDSLHSDTTVRLLSTSGDQIPVLADAANLTPGAVTGWAKYPLGVVWALQQHGIEVPGFDLLLDSDVPLGAGLSSSHAIECAVVTALNDLTGAGLTAEEMVRLTQHAENAFVGAPTGIMDQSASLRGASGHAVFLDCRDQAVQLVPFAAQEAGLVLLVIDTKVSHSHADGGYASRRASCELGAEILGVKALRDVAIADLEQASGLLDPVTFRRVRHIVTENDRVRQTVATLRAQGPAHIGSLLDASHASMRDDFEISCPELDLAVDTARAHGAIGARMTGGGFGGSAIALTPVAQEQQVRDAVVHAFAEAGLTRPDIFTVTPAAGAERLR